MKRDAKPKRKARAATAATRAESGAAVSEKTATAVRTPVWMWGVPPLLAVLLYAVTLANGFVLDDRVLLFDDPRLGSLRAFFDLRPGELVVRYWSLLADSAVWGLNPLGFHLTNVLLHALCGLAVFAWLRALLRARPETVGGALFGLAWSDLCALAGALLFTAHPMQTEAVAGVTHRKEVLATLFMVIALHRSLPASRGILNALAVGAAMALALFAKAPAVVFFPLVLLQDLWVRGRRPGPWLRRDLVFYLPAVIALAGYLAYRWAGLSGALDGDAVYFDAYNPQAAGLPTGARLLTALVVLGLYWRLMWIPWRPILERHVEPVRNAADPLPWFLLIVALAALAVAFRIGRRRPLVALGLAWLVLAPLPTLNIVPLNFLFSERYLYLPVLGAVLVVTGLLAAAPPRPVRRRRLGAAAVALALLLFAPLVIVRGLEWRDTSTLLAATVRDNRNAPRVSYLHALDLRNQGRIPESLAACRRALQDTPRLADAWHLAGRNYTDLGQRSEALQALGRAVELARRPDPAWLNDYAVALIQAGRAQEALPVLEQAVERDPDNGRFAENRAQLLLLRPETRAEGMTALRELTARHPDQGSAWILLVEAELASGLTDEAAASTDRARAALSDDATRLFLDARVREGRGERTAAAAEYAALLSRDDLDDSLRRRVEAARKRAVTPATAP